MDKPVEQKRKMDTVLLNKEFQEIEEECRKLSFDEKMQLGKQVFGKCFGELCEQKGEIARAEFDEGDDGIKE